MYGTLCLSVHSTAASSGSFWLMSTPMRSNSFGTEESSSRVGAVTAMSASASSTAEIGRVTKMAPLPCDSVSDWRSEFSKIGPSTRPRIIGAADQS